MDSRLEAAQTLRRFALDEELKSVVMGDARLAALARRVAARYVAGESVEQALGAARSIVTRGHRVSVEYAGESVRHGEIADAEASVFVELAAEIARSQTPATVSGDLSHIGLLVDRGLALENARRIVTALGGAATFMISAEGSDRTDAVLDVYEELVASGHDVGITLQARLHRSPGDLDRLLRLPGRIRLVKGAFLEPEEIALSREDPRLADRYLSLATAIAAAGRPLTLATHDEPLLRRVLADVLNSAQDLEIEMLMGLGTDLLDRLRDEGFTTREYAVFGDQWWLYVLNRIAENPDRLFDLVADLGSS
ncbi:proline dehydrogenase [Microbacterium bovistercoris]|uniref:Proline dehydrogenase n=1 Tax=Microbacterium bovistercoris TaxID=2293570 RepID=A0A371NQX3_9MICO|nr:proline dehydrogenase family protein [Microbacterium bovistercoris]REJ04137.1 proline dehydrogenase [Microbacterium bovistercoris]